jgi:ABC-type antimicrobial peptide transport system permease subunit
MVLLLAGFAVAALLLASIGIYGVVSYTVGRRTQEIGLRMALGASTLRVQTEIMRRVVSLVSGGLVAGVIGSLIVARLMAALLFDLKPADPLTLAGTVLLLLVVAIAAAYLPALRASRVDPMKALRTD